MLMRWIRRIALVAASFCLVLLLFVGGSRMILHWAQPDPQVLSLTPMTFDAKTRSAVGILLNASGRSGTVLVLTVNSTTGEQFTQTITYSTDPMQAVPYFTPPFLGPTDLRTTLIFARSMEQDYPGTHVSEPSN